MIFVLFVSLFCLLIGSIIMYGMSEYPGYILINVGGVTFESTLWFAIVVAIVAVVVLRIVQAIVKKIWRACFGTASLWRVGRDRKAERKTQSGLIHFVEGNWQAAKKDLLSAAKDVKEPLVHYLAAAKSAHELGNSEETHLLLHQAEQIAPQNEFAITLSQAKIQLSDKKYEQCLATLERIRNQATNNPTVLDLLRRVYINLKDWPALVALLPEIKKSGLLSTQEFTALEENAYMSLLDAYANAPSDEQSVLQGEQAKDITGIEKAEQAWNEFPKAIKKNHKLVGLYCQILHYYKRDEEAAQLLSKTLKNNWYTELVILYGKLNLEDIKQQLTTAEAWLRDHKEDAHLYFALGKICLKNQLWGKAKDYFSQSLKIKERPEVYAELGALLAQLGEHKQSTSMYQKGLLLTTR